VPGPEQVKALKAGVGTLVSENLVANAAVANKAIDDLVDALSPRG